MDDGDLALLMALVSVQRGCGEHEKAAGSAETLLQLAKELGRRDLEAQADMEAALNEEASGNLSAALDQLKRTEVILREQGNSEGLGAVYLRSGMILVQMGERDRALVELRESARHAERSGNPMALASALEELGRGARFDIAGGPGLSGEGTGAQERRPVKVLGSASSAYLAAGVIDGHDLFHSSPIPVLLLFRRIRRDRDDWESCVPRPARRSSSPFRWGHLSLSGKGELRYNGHILTNDKPDLSRSELISDL